NQEDMNYEARAITEFVAKTPAGQADKANDVDFYQSVNGATVNEQNRGWITRVIASPQAFPNSPDAIGVAAPRNDRRPQIAGQGAMGGGVKLGQIELGRPYATHADLPLAALSLDNQATNAFYADEHALAVAGIMVGRNGNAERAGIAPGAKLYSTAYTAYN